MSVILRGEDAVWLTRYLEEAKPDPKKREQAAIDREVVARRIIPLSPRQKEADMTNVLRGWLEAAPDEELEAALAQLKTEIVDIDTQLAGAGRMEGGEFRLSFQEYQDWRRRAVGAKTAKTKEMLSIKAEVARRRIANPRPASESTFWRTQGRQFLEALENLENMELPPRAQEIVDRALDSYGRAVQRRGGEGIE